jgi:hypothetical protein
MKRKILYLFLLSLPLSLFGGEHDFDFQYWTEHGRKFSIGPVTVEQAKQSIINWAGRTNLQIELAPIYNWETPAAGRIPNYTITPDEFPLGAELTTWYAFGVRDPNPDNKYRGTVYVDSYTGAVKGIFRRNPGIKENGQISDMLPPQQAINLAKEYITSYFPDIPIDSFAMEIIGPDSGISEDGSTWKGYTDFLYFSFTNKLHTPDGKPVWIDVQHVAIGMDSETGELCEIFCCFEPIEISPVPTLTKEQLAEAVTSYLNGLGASVVEIRQLNGDTGPGWWPGEDKNDWWLSRQEPYGSQRLYTDLWFYIEGVPGLPDGAYFAAVDGHTGEIFNGGLAPLALGGPKVPTQRPSSLSIFFNGLKRKTNMAPLIREGKVYISVIDLKKWGFKLKKEGKGYVISYGANAVKIGNNDVIKRGQNDYIMGESIGKIKGFMVRYNKKFNQFHIISVDWKAFERGKQDRAKFMKMSMFLPILVLAIACCGTEYF